MPLNNRIWLVACVVCLFGLPPLASQAQSSTPDPQKIKELITQLGDRTFLVRERAQTDLARMGVAAFDELFGAMRDNDLEIAQRAQYLIRSVQIEWTRPEFSEEVNSYLSRYANLNVEDRRSRIASLARLHTIDALSALCRISRYDISESLSKEAALAAAIQFQDAQGEEKEKVAKVITDRIGESPRTGPSWMKVFRQSLDQPSEAAKKWETLVRTEIDLFTTRPALTSQQTVLDLVRWQVDHLRSEGKQEEALDSMREVLPISAKFSESQLLDLTTWLLDRKGPSVVGELAELHAKRKPAPENQVIGGPFGENPSLLYLLAEAELVQNHIDQAERYADAARELQPDAFDSHYLTAQTLQERGCFRWSRREFEYVIDNNDIDDRFSLQARRQYAEMEHDHGFSAKAAEIMWPWVEFIEKRLPAKRDPFGAVEAETYGGYLSRAYLFRATAKEQQGNLKAAKEDLLKALKYEEDEPDALIAAYRLGKKDEMWNTKAREHIDHTLEFYKPYVKDFQEKYDFFKRNRRSNNDVMGAQSAQMAMYCNQYAWLVANTYGDFDHAIESSLLSLELQPGNGAYLDTLAHCYEAKGDWGKAAKYQRQAVQQMPHSGMVRKKYFEFAEQCKKHMIEFQPIELPASPDTHFPDYQKEGER